MDTTIKVLDRGYVKYIGHMGSDETFVEAARMSTGKGFLGWYWEDDTYSDCRCNVCETHHLSGDLPKDDDGLLICTNCWNSEIVQTEFEADFEPELLGKKGQKRDLSLLEYLYSNRHSTPFEMGELAIEVEAPLFVFREWHRHRTQSYNEFSGRYSQMPNKHYVPAEGRIQKQSKSNKQGSSEALPPEDANRIRTWLELDQAVTYNRYEQILDYGVAKEIARLNTPVSRYSKMRAKADIRNWLAFLSLRMEMSAQWEIRQYANAVASIIKSLFPRTFELFLEWDFLGARFSRSEMSVIREYIWQAESHGYSFMENCPLPVRAKTALYKRLTEPKSDLYREVLEKL